MNNEVYYTIGLCFKMLALGYGLGYTCTKTYPGISPLLIFIPLMLIGIILSFKSES